MRALDTINTEITTFKRKVQISDGISFDHYEILKRINLYANDEFFECDEDDAIFWNLGKERVPHFAKKIDLDTRHFLSYARGDNNSYQTWVLNLRFQKWAKDSGFSLDLDDLSEGLAAYGSMVMKLTKKKGGGYDLNECDLTRLYFDTTAETLEGKTKIEEHQLTEYELWEKAEAWGGADKIKEALKVAEIVPGTEDDAVITKYKIFERVGYWMAEDNKKPVYKRIVGCGSGDKEVLFVDDEIKPDDDPFYDFHLSKYMGRWLRIGVYERLFTLQEQANKYVNQDDQAAQIASLLLLLSNDPQLVGKNVLKEAVSGEVIDAQMLEQLRIDNRAFGEFVQKMNMYEAKADKLCMTLDAVTGDMPKDTPVRSQIISANTINSAFKSTRDRVSFKISKLLVDKILPEEIRKWNQEEILEMSQNDIDVRMFDTVAIKYHLNNFIKENWKRGRNPSQQEKEVFVQKMLMEFETKGRKIKDMKNFFNFDFGIMQNPTGEVENKEERNSAYESALNWFMANPMIMNIPLYRNYLEFNQIPSFKLTSEEVAQFMQGQQAAPGAQVPQPEPRDAMLSELNE